MTVLPATALVNIKAWTFSLFNAKVWRSERDAELFASFKSYPTKRYFSVAFDNRKMKFKMAFIPRKIKFSNYVKIKNRNRIRVKNNKTTMGFFPCFIHPDPKSERLILDSHHWHLLWKSNGRKLHAPDIFITPTPPFKTGFNKLIQSLQQQQQQNRTKVRFRHLV